MAYKKRKPLLVHRTEIPTSQQQGSSTMRNTEKSFKIEIKINMGTHWLHYLLVMINNGNVFLFILHLCWSLFWSWSVSVFFPVPPWVFWGILSHFVSIFSHFYYWRKINLFCFQAFMPMSGYLFIYYSTIIYFSLCISFLFSVFISWYFFLKSLLSLCVFMVL